MSNVRSRQTRLPPLSIRASSQSRLQALMGTNASKRPYRSQGNRACSLAVALAASPGPPVRWRSAHCRCNGRHLSSHGRPEAPSVSAGNYMESSRAIGRIGCGLPGQAARLCALSSAGTLLSMHLLYGCASIGPGAPAPNPSIERTCLKPLRAFSPTAHVKR